MTVESPSLLEQMWSANFWIVMIWTWFVELIRYEPVCTCLLFCLVYKRSVWYKNLTQHATVYWWTSISKTTSSWIVLPQKSWVNSILIKLKKHCTSYDLNCFCAGIAWIWTAGILNASHPPKKCREVFDVYLVSQQTIPFICCIPYILIYRTFIIVPTKIKTAESLIAYSVTIWLVDTKVTIDFYLILYACDCCMCSNFCTLLRLWIKKMQ